jgi:hypothetical protein
MNEGRRNCEFAEGSLCRTRVWNSYVKRPGSASYNISLENEDRMRMHRLGMMLTVVVN